MAIDVPLTFSDTGPVPTDPETLRALILESVKLQRPGYSALPAGLIDSILSTDTVAATSMDLGRVDALNQLTPYAANPYILAQQGELFGIPKGQQSNASAFVVFTGPAGLILTPKFLVSDGTNIFSIVDGGTIGADGTSPPLQAIAVDYWEGPVLVNSVNQIATSIPQDITLTVTNPEAGVPASAPETTAQYRGRVMDAQLVTCQGTTGFLKTLLRKLPDVNPRLVSVKSYQSGWQVICGGGDPYQVAGQIILGILNVSSLRGARDPLRTISVSVTQIPDTYTVLYVNPKAQSVQVNLQWQTDIQNFPLVSQVNQLAAPEILRYINSLYVGTPINILDIQVVFQEAVRAVLDPQNISAISAGIRIDGIAVNPPAGSSLIQGDPEGFFESTSTDILVSKFP